MSLRQITIPGFGCRLLGRLLAVLAVVSQLALGSVFLPDEASAQQQVAALDALSVLCDSTTPILPSGQPAHQRHSHGGPLCPLSVTLALPAVVLASAPDLPLPQGRSAGQSALPPPSRGPSTQPRYALLPRGPPALT